MLLKGLLSLAVLGMLFGGCEDDTKETTVQDTKPVAQVEQQVEPQQVTKNTINEDEFTKIDNLTEGQDDMKVMITGKVKNVYDEDKFTELMLDECNDTAYPLIVVIPDLILNDGVTFEEGDEVTIYGRIDGLNTKENVEFIKLSAYAVVK